MPAEDLIFHECASKQITMRSRMLDTSTVNGLKCVWNGSIINNRTAVSMSWVFDWNELRDIGVDELDGEIKLSISDGYNDPHTATVNAKLTESNQVIEYKMNTIDWMETYDVSMEYTFKPLRVWIEKYDKMFEASDETDGVLLIEEKKVHVNKAFLSYHSGFFKGLFNSSMLEAGLSEIPVKEVTYADFGLLMCCIYPDNIFPNDKTVVRLAALGHRFLMKSVLNHVQYHLLNNSSLNNEVKLAMADAYGLEELMEMMLLNLNIADNVRLLKNSPEYSDLSDRTKSRICDKIIDLI